jgi:putative transposase
METLTLSSRIATATALVLDEVLRDGARAMLQQAIEREVAEYVSAHAAERDPATGRRLVVRNGHLPARAVLTGLGPIEVQQPRVDDRRVDPVTGKRAFRFTPRVLPPYLRRAKAVEDLVPWLYLKGISTSDFPEALAPLLGQDVSGLSPTNVVRMKEVWRGEWTEWSKRDLKAKRYVYLWADGVYFNIRLAEAGEGRQCVLVLMGATADGVKELIAVRDGHRESEQSWLELLRGLRDRGLEGDPEIAVGDGSLGFWKALPQVFPKTRAQRCWMHKTCNVLNHFPKSRQPAAKAALQAVWMAARKTDALAALAKFERDYRAKYPKAVECLLKDREELLAFYDFPAEHWSHLRTTNPIESTFATVRLRTAKTKGCGSRQACLTMVFKLCQSAERHWRKLNGCALLREVSEGIVFVDGIRKAA